MVVTSQNSSLAARITPDSSRLIRRHFLLVIKKMQQIRIQDGDVYESKGKQRNLGLSSRAQVPWVGKCRSVGWGKLPTSIDSLLGSQSIDKKYSQTETERGGSK